MLISACFLLCTPPPLRRREVILLCRCLSVHHQFSFISYAGVAPTEMTELCLWNLWNPQISALEIFIILILHSQTCGGNNLGKLSARRLRIVADDMHEFIRFCFPNGLIWSYILLLLQLRYLANLLEIDKNLANVPRSYHILANRGGGQLFVTKP